jgi:hypothetical protein
MRKKSKQVSFPPLETAARKWGVQGLKHFGVCHHRVWILKAANGSRVALKRVKSNVFTKHYDKIEVDRVIGILNRKFCAIDKIKRLPGVPEIAAPFPLADDSDQFVFKWEGGGYCLMPYFEGGRPTYRQSHDTQRVLRSLGQLHMAGQENQDSLIGLGVSTAPPSVRCILDRELDIYRQALTLVQELDCGRLLRRMLLSKQDLVRDLISSAQAIMERSADADYRKAPLHGDTNQSNFLFSECLGKSNERINKCVLLDVETFRCGFGAEDLIIPFSIHCAHGKFLRGGVEKLLSAYEAECPLTENERSFVYANLVLPRHWLRIVQRFRKGSRAWWSPLYLRKLHLALKCLPAQKCLAESVLGS